MAQHTGRIKPGMGSFGKVSQPSRSNAPKTQRQAGGFGKAMQLVGGRAVLESNLPRTKSKPRR